MVYPDTAEGFLVHDHKKWSDFKKEEVPDSPCHNDKRMTDDIPVPSEDF